MSLLHRISQANTFASIQTSLGNDVFLLEGLRGVERTSRLFHFELDLLSVHPPVKFGEIVGNGVTIRIDQLGTQAPRYLHGYISQISQLRAKHGFACYKAEMVPWLWFLTRTTDSGVQGARSQGHQAGG